MKPSPDNVLIIGDPHIPFEHKDYLQFCCTMRDRCKCTTIVHIGDLVDNHAISYHEHDPNGWSPEDEINEAVKRLKKWYKEFPVVRHCIGNHDCLVDRKGKTVGLPARVFRPFREIWELPASWESEFGYTIDKVRYQHGTQYSGALGHMKAVLDNRMSTVIGHLPAFAAVNWTANDKDLLFGMNVGCGIDRNSYAMAYGKDFGKKPILSVGIVTDKGRFAQVMPMQL